MKNGCSDFLKNALYGLDDPEGPDVEKILAEIAEVYRVQPELILGSVDIVQGAEGEIRFVGEGFAMFRWQGLTLGTALQATKEWAKAKFQPYGFDTHAT